MSGLMSSRRYAQQLAFGRRMHMRTGSSSLGCAPRTQASPWRPFGAHVSSSRPSCTISAARSTALALFCVSCHSDSGTESWTMPAPTCT